LISGLNNLKPQKELMHLRDLEVTESEAQNFKRDFIVYKEKIETIVRVPELRREIEERFGEQFFYHINKPWRTDINRCIVFNKNVIINIPKHASTSLKTISQEHLAINNLNFNIENCIVILRDPLKRWVSALYEFIYLSREEDFNYILNNLKKIELGRYFIPQHVYVDNAKKYAKNFHFYLLEEHGLDKFNEDFKVFNQVPKLYTTEENGFKTKYKKYIDKYFDDELFSLIKEYYYKDYELIHKEIHNARL
jgi:hypothetical protein